MSNEGKEGDFFDNEVHESTDEGCMTLVEHLTLDSDDELPTKAGSHGFDYFDSAEDSAELPPIAGMIGHPESGISWVSPDHSHSNSEEPESARNQAGGNHEEGDAAQAVVRKPKFAYKCQLGYATEEARSLWVARHRQNSIPSDEEAMSLVASKDTTKPMYYWQLFSILGKEQIDQLIRKFYEYVYADEEYTKLKKVFQKVPNTTPQESMEHHIKTQSQYWVDALGGGKKYHGGFGRLEFHHRYNGMEVMNTEAATRWTFHMNRAIVESDFTADPRVKDCLCDFLKTHMDKYGEQFKFNTQKLSFGTVCEEVMRDKRSSRRREREVEEREREEEVATGEKREHRKGKTREGGAKKGGGRRKR